MIVREYSLDWYNNCDVKFFKSNRAYERWGCKEVCHTEYGFMFKKDCLDEVILLRLFEYVEKNVTVNVVTGLPCRLPDKIFFNGLFYEFSYYEFLKFPMEEKHKDSNMVHLSELTQRDGKTIVFQQRVPWELHDMAIEDTKYYSVYGRFSVAVV